MPLKYFLACPTNISQQAPQILLFDAPQIFSLDDTNHDSAFSAEFLHEITTQFLERSGYSVLPVYKSKDTLFRRALRGALYIATHYDTSPAPILFLCSFGYQAS